MLSFATSLFRTKKNARAGRPFLLDQEAFDTAAAAERMRVDRNGSVLSLLLIDLAPQRRDPTAAADISKFEQMMAARLRLTDTAGWMRDGRLGVLLPDTPSAGAWKVAADLCETLPVGASRPDCEVVVYPDPAGSPQKAETAGDPSAADAGGPVSPSGVSLASQRGVAQGSLAEFDRLFIDPAPVWKRTLDIVGASVGLVLVGPLIVAAAAVAKITSPGPAFFSQDREGLGGRRFRIWKIRTMRTDAEALKAELRVHSEQDGPAFKMRNDPRITPLGSLLRKTSIDELPQLWNVLRGDMSLVGPRPLPVDESLACQPWQRRRLHVKPGITCIWQIHGRNVVPFDDWIRMDLDYAARQSPLLDMKLVLQTGPALVLPKGQ